MTAADTQWKSVKGALKDLKVFDCFVEHFQGKRDELVQCGDEQFFMDYVSRIIKWYTRSLSRPEVARYAVPNLELPNFAVIHDQITRPKVQNKNNELIAIKNYLMKMSKGGQLLKKNVVYFNMRDEEFRYERRVVNFRQNLAKQMKKVTSERDLKSLNDNQFLLYHRAWSIWKSIQLQAQKNGDVRITSAVTRDPDAMFPISKFSEILVDTPPLPSLGSFARYETDVRKFKQVIADRNPKLLADKEDHELIVVPSMRPVFFDEPTKWRRLGRRSPSYP